MTKSLPNTGSPQYKLNESLYARLLENFYTLSNNQVFSIDGYFVPRYKLFLPWSTNNPYFTRKEKIEMLDFILRCTNMRNEPLFQLTKSNKWKVNLIKTFSFFELKRMLDKNYEIR